MIFYARRISSYSNLPREHVRLWIPFVARWNCWMRERECSSLCVGSDATWDGRHPWLSEIIAVTKIATLIPTTFSERYRPSAFSRGLTSNERGEKWRDSLDSCHSVSGVVCVTTCVTVRERTHSDCLVSVVHFELVRGVESEPEKVWTRRRHSRSCWRITNLNSPDGNFGWKNHEQSDSKTVDQRPETIKVLKRKRDGYPAWFTTTIAPVGQRRRWTFPLAQRAARKHGQR